MRLPAVLFAVLAVAADRVDYARDVRPLLQDRCFACHGVLAQKGGLRLDGGANVRKGGVIVPGKPDESVLIERVSDPDESTRMPPEGLPLKPEQIAKLRAWVEQGATFPADDRPEPDPRDHWAFRPPTRPAVPGTGHPIDAFLAAEQRKHGLTPVGEAEPRVLVRRLYLDLIGLPPTPEQVAAFARDPSPAGYAKVVDELLASPHYGERWGRHFLDVWRYSDWWGLGAEVRNSQKHMWHWRDWTIESFNRDLGYDEMVRRMLAADELHPTDLGELRAGGYLARQYFKFNRNSWLDETVEHTAKAFLGLTLNCARCHDHKYDPIGQRDYYAFRAIFEPYQVRQDILGETDPEKDALPRPFDCDPDRPTFLFVRGDDKRPVTDKPIKAGLPAFLAPGGFHPRAVSLPAEAHSPHLRPHVVEVFARAAKATDGDAGERAVRARADADRTKASGPADQFRAAAKRAAAAEKAVAVARAEKTLAAADATLAKTVGVRRIGPAFARTKAADALAKAKAADPGEAYTPLKGAVKTAESNVETEAVRNRPFPATSTGRRTALANWIASPANPLTARVAVNHVWLRHFGRPLVPTVFDFGRKGQPPSHPALLDWLAVELAEHRWSLKHLHRLIVTSAAYRRSSSVAGADPATRSADSENRYLWRMNPVRMDAPTVRDSLLALAGDLDRTAGGPAVPAKEQPTSRRRGVYFFQSHNEHDTFLSIFDDANVLECYRRTESVVPQQALALSNSPLASARAEAIAGRIMTAGDEAFAVAAFERVLGSTPTPAERAACVETLAELTAAAPGTAAEKAKRARVNLVLALLNHNDFVTVR